MGAGIHTWLSFAAGHYESKYIVARVIFLHRTLGAFTRSGLSHTSFQRSILSGCIPRSISLLQEDISLGRLQTLLVICASTDWVMCLFAVLFALSQPQPLPPTANPRRDGGKETKTVSLGADDVNVISRRECHSGIKTEGGSDRRNTANSARRCVWELTPPHPHPAAAKIKKKKQAQDPTNQERARWSGAYAQHQRRDNSQAAVLKREHNSK